MDQPHRKARSACTHTRFDPCMDKQPGPPSAPARLQTSRPWTATENQSPPRANSLRIIDRVFDSTATGNHFIRQEPHANNVIVSYAISHFAINFERQTHAILSRSAVAISTIILRAQKPRHRVSVRVVKLNSIKPCLACSLRSRSKNPRQLARQLANVLQVRVGNALAITETKRFQFTRPEHKINNFVASVLQKLADLCRPSR